MKDKLTEKQFWLEYWEKKTDLIESVSKNNYFSSVFKKIIKDSSIKTSIEIGGFPGYFSIYLKKYFNIEPTLLDYIIHEKIISDLLKCNNLTIDSLGLIETDLFNVDPQDQFDLTFSFGFIEHFSDTKDLIKRHVNFLKPDGTLLIIVPNLLGFNGWINRKFDFEVYTKHFLNCMDKNILKESAKSCQLKEIETYYFGKFSIWLENYSNQNLFFRIFFKIIWIIGKLITKIIPIETKLFSPYTILLAKKIDDK